MNSSPHFTEGKKGITDAVPVHIMQSRSISGGIAPLVLNLSTIWSWVVSFIPSHFTLYLPSSQSHIWYPQNRRLSEHHSWSEPFAGQRNLVPTGNRTTIPRLPSLCLVMKVILQKYKWTVEANGREICICRELRTTDKMLPPVLKSSFSQYLHYSMLHS